MKAIDRIFEYFSIKGIKHTAFERKYGLSNGYLGTMKKRSADIGEGVMAKVLEACPDLEAEWLITGEGNMLKTDEEGPVVIVDSGRKFEDAMAEVYEEAISKKDEENRAMLREISRLKAEILILKESCMNK